MSSGSGNPESRFHPVHSVLVAFFSPDGRPQILGAAWVGIICSRPSVLSLTVKRPDTKALLLPSGGSFSVNLPREEIVTEPTFRKLLANQDTDLLPLLGLSLRKGSVTPGPTIEGCPIRIECRLISLVERFGEETVSGEVLAVQVGETVHGMEAPVDLCRLKSFVQRAQRAGLPMPQVVAEHPAAAETVHPDHKLPPRLN